MAQGIAKRPAGRVGDGHADAAQLVVVLDVVGAEEEVVLAVGVYGRRRPDGIGRPRDVLHIQHVLVLGPVDDVGRGEGVEEGLLEEGRPYPRRLGALPLLPGCESGRDVGLAIVVGIGRIDPVPAGEDADFRIGVPAGHDRIARHGRRSYQDTRRHRRKKSPHFPSLEMMLDIRFADPMMTP